MVLLSGRHALISDTHAHMWRIFFYFFRNILQALNILESFKINSSCPSVSRERYEMVEESQLAHINILPYDKCTKVNCI